MQTNFSLINSYMASAMLVLLPIVGMMLISYSAYTLWKDLRGQEGKKIRERLREKDAQRYAKKIEQSIAKAAREDKSLFEATIGKIHFTAKIERYIQQADLNVNAAPFLTNVALAALIFIVVGMFMKLSVWTIAIVAAAILYLPIFVIQFLASRRIKKMVDQLPDVFELISQALRAGHSLASGIQLIGKQLPDPVGSEFARIFHEQNLGIKIDEALSNFADRTGQLDIRFFVTAVLIQRQTGGDLAEILDKIGFVIRDRIKIMGQVQALTAEGRMSGWVLSALPVFMFFLAWTLNPGYAGVLLHEKEGQYMLGMAVFFQVIGMLMIKKIVNIKI